MRQLLISAQQIRKATINNGFIYVDWSSDFELLNKVSKIKVARKKKPEYTLCNENGKTKVKIIFSNQAIDMLLEANQEDINELRNQIAASDVDIKAAQSRLNRLNKSIEIYEKLTASKTEKAVI